jgi:hypothetical protein
MAEVAAEVASNRRRVNDFVFMFVSPSVARAASEQGRSAEDKTSIRGRVIPMPLR